MSALSTVGIIGLGLVGGSIARLIREESPDCLLIGVDPDPQTRQFALDSEIVHRVYAEIPALEGPLDLAIICTPIPAISAAVTALSARQETPLLLTDVGSIKTALSEPPYPLKPGHTFIPGHPMAGSEKTGIFHANAAIMRGAAFILTAPESDALHRLQKFLSRQGFHMVILNPAHHDQLMASASHFPYLMAQLTAENARLLTGDDPTLLRQIVAGGFHDTTRVSESDSGWGVDVCHYNRANMLAAIQNARQILDHYEALITADDQKSLNTQFETTRQWRKRLYQSDK